RPAYRYGTQARASRPDASWTPETEAELERGWERARGESRLGWAEAKAAVRDAWHRGEHRLPGDADGDGRGPRRPGPPRAARGPPARPRRADAAPSPVGRACEMG